MLSGHNFPGLTSFKSCSHSFTQASSSPNGQRHRIRHRQVSMHCTWVYEAWPPTESGKGCLDASNFRNASRQLIVCAAAVRSVTGWCVFFLLTGAAWLCISAVSPVSSAADVIPPWPAVAAAPAWPIGTTCDAVVASTTRIFNTQHGECLPYTACLTHIHRVVCCLI